MLKTFYPQLFEDSALSIELMSNPDLVENYIKNPQLIAAFLAQKKQPQNDDEDKPSEEVTLLKRQIEE